MSEGFFRYINKKIDYNDTENKFTLAFNVESIDESKPNARTIAAIAIDAMADYIESNGEDPDVFINEILKQRISRNQ